MPFLRLSVALLPSQTGTSEESRGLIGTGSNQASAIAMTSKSVLAGLVIILVFALGVAY